jgi:nicotinate-nucleotide adenylyltransferase
MRIGILGGTFNPVHFGHLRSAEEVREAQGLDRILFIPSAMPPHKRLAAVAAAEHRLAMVRLAIAGNPHFHLSAIEVERGGRSYSVDTLRLLRRRMPAARFAFILGMDAFCELATWKEYASIFTLCDLVVTSRAGASESALRGALPVAVRRQFCYRTNSRELEHRTGNRIIFQPITDLDISASAIRHRLRRGLSVRYLVPASVERYITRQRLYAGRSLETE